ncbi:MAG: N-6 DNA methylase [Maricaulis maris]
MGDEMKLSGIENEAEFFPSGTLSDVLKDELQDITGLWRSMARADHPVDRLQAAGEACLSKLQQIRATTASQRRLELYREMQQGLLKALGYEPKRALGLTALKEATHIPLLAQVANSEGRVALWAVEAALPSTADEANDPLGLLFDETQFLESEQEYAELKRPLEEILADGVFALDDAPKDVLVFGLSQIVLIDKRKWPARSVLRFDLQEIFADQDKDTLTVMACLISREARVPDQGVPIADRLEEEAQRNANAVTSSLKRTVRDAIEILGQEVLDVTGGKHPSGHKRAGVWIEGPELSRECLRYMYRLLFLFYAEANTRLNILDIKNSVYASGYSIEALRDLESVRLRTPSERDGSYLWESLQRTLTLLFEGEDAVLKLPSVKVSLLDPKSTPLLNSVTLRNQAIQKIIRLLSLRTGKSTGRISYAKLGIGQLGAVYETLISFTGTVAKTDMIELKPQKDRKKSGGKANASDDGGDDGSDVEEEAPPESNDDDSEALDESAGRSDRVDKLAPSYFVPRSRLDEFDPEDVIFKGGQALIYPKGSFTYRLAGRDREKSASYYTPEPLARLLVKHALMERCKDLTADEILELKILEPAMGSAAFLVETANQLADLYLERKQKEVGKTIPQDEIVLEKQKVRAFISDRNCFGVDLNPIAVELGAISLWLNSLHASDFSPWFGDQLHAGNSLLGARRAAYAPLSLRASKKNDLWLETKPEEIGWRNRLPEDHVWQWLLPAKDMANFDKDTSIKPFAGDAQDAIKAWRKAGFFKKFEPHEVKLVQKLSAIADKLFDQVADDLAKTREASNDAITLWPDREMSGNKKLDFLGKEFITARLTGDDHASNTLPYKRLKTAMDAWCALWLWPLDKAHLLPDRTEFLHGMTMLLEGGFSASGTLAAPSLDEFADPEPDFLDQLEPDAPARDLFKVAERRQAEFFHETNVEALVENFDWLKVAVEVAEEARFVHFDLIFADVMRSRGGFDLIVGNPPWAKPSWNAGLVLADIDPLYAGLSASDAEKALPDALAKTKGKDRFVAEFAATRGAMEVTSSEVMNPFAGGGSNNLYRCFVDLSWRLVAPAGYSALIHQDGHLGDPKAGAFRQHWYARIVKHFGYINTIKSKNFADAAHYMRFSQNIYRGSDAKPCFDQFTTAFLPSQITDSYDHDGIGELPDLKDKTGNWDTRGHRARIVKIDQRALEVVHALSEDDDVPVEQARFIQPFSENTLDVFKRMARFPKLGSAVSDWQMSAHWNETAAQKDGTIRRETAFRPADEIVLQGPHIYVGNPIYKTPRSICRAKADYDLVDLLYAPADYLPRSNYAPAVPLKTYSSRITKCDWDTTKSHADFFRFSLRRRLNLNMERTLSGALLPPKLTHVHGVESIAFRETEQLVLASTAAISLVWDFLTKIRGKEDIHSSTVEGWPWVVPAPTAVHRALRLMCLTEQYSDLWNDQAVTLVAHPWSSTDHRLTLEGPIAGPASWQRSAALRTEFARRLALVEIDVLVAQALGLTLDQLIEIYRIYFPVLQKNEAGTWYDQNGRIVWTCSKGLPGVGYMEANKKGEMKSPGRAAWEKILAENPAELTCTVLDDTMPGGPREVTRRFVGPFDTCDRVEDYKRAWAHFGALKADGGDT